MMQARGRDRCPPALPPALVLLLALACLAGPAAAWFTPAHMVISAVAQRHLEPTVAEVVNQFAGGFAEFYPGRSADIVDVSGWMDNVKHSGLRLFDTWHYVDRPIIDPVYNPRDSTDPLDPNLVTSLTESVLSLSGKAGTDQRYNRPDDWTNAFLIRLFVHLMGDLHQPLHCAQFFSSVFPRGDRGGARPRNEIELDPPAVWTTDGGPAGNKEVYSNNLHAFWDGAAGALRDGEREDVNVMAKKIDEEILANRVDRYELNLCDDSGCPLFPKYSTIKTKDEEKDGPMTPEEVKKYWTDQFTVWANASQEVAREVVYSTHVRSMVAEGAEGAPGTVNTSHTFWPGYASAAELKSLLQLGVAGHHLAVVLNSIFQGVQPSPSPPPSPSRSSWPPGPAAAAEHRPSETVAALSVCLAVATVAAGVMTRLYLRARWRWFRGMKTTYSAGEFDLPRSSFQPLDEEEIK